MSEYDFSDEYRNDKQPNRPKSKRYGAGVRRRLLAQLVDVSTAIFCSGVHYDGKRVSVAKSIDLAEALIFLANEKVDGWEKNGKKATEKLPEV